MHALDEAGGGSLLVFKHHLHRPLPGSGGVMPVDRVILAQALAPLLHADRTVQAAAFFHAHHRFLALVADLIAQEELFYGERFGRTRAGPEKQGRHKAEDAFHAADSTSVRPGFKKHPATNGFSPFPEPAFRSSVHAMNQGDTAELKLEFDTPHFLHGLFANDPKNLAYLESALLVKAVARDGWVLLTGAPAALQRAKAVFADLENAQRQGGRIETRDFRLAVDVAAKEGAINVADLSAVKLVGSRGRKPVIPKTPAQLEYVRAIETHDVVFGLGPAGTGKTYLAMAMALTLLKRRVMQRIILTRPAVEAGEALGFLPGDLREKVAPYLRPLYDAIHDMLDPEEGQRYLEEGTIEIAPLAFMRGRTLSRSFVILDEAQNTTREQMFMALTRLGDESRMVVTGDSSQVDLKPGVRSGLAEAEHALAGVDGIAFQRFSQEDIIRHPVVGRIVEAYERYRS